MSAQENRSRAGRRSRPRGDSLDFPRDPEVLEGHPVPWISTEADPYKAIRQAGAFSR